MINKRDDDDDDDMGGQRATGKIQRNNYHHGSCRPSLRVKRRRCL